LIQDVTLHRADSVSIHSTETPDASLILSLVKPYFTKLQTQYAVERYCRSSSLGAALFHFAYWGNRLAGLLSSFPFPLIIDCERVIVWKPELASLHRDVAFDIYRPDIYAILLDELIRSARERGVRFLQTWPSPVARNPHRKKGFQMVGMPFTNIFWPLRAKLVVDRASRIVAARLGQRVAVAEVAKYLAQALTFLPLRAVAKLVTTGSQRFTFRVVPIESLGDLDLSPDIFTCTDRRIYTPCDLDLLSSRLREEDGYEFLSIVESETSMVIGALILQLKSDGFILVDGGPSHVYSTREFWISFIRYAINRGASYVSVRLYKNNSAHCAALSAIRHRIPGLMVDSEAVFAVLALDKRLEFAYSPLVWAGSDMLGVGF